MKLISILMFLLLNSHVAENNVKKTTFCKLEIKKYYQNPFNQTQLDFIKERSDDKIYYIKKENILVAYNWSDLEILSKNVITSFELNTYLESNFKFNIIDKKKRKIGNVYVEEDINGEDKKDKISIYLNNKKIVNQIGISEFVLSPKNILKN